MSDTPDRAAEALRTTILERALAVRAPGRPVAAPEPSTPLAAFEAAAEQLASTLRTFTGDDWLRPAHDGIGTVRDVVAHLYGVERMVLGWVTAPADEDPVVTEHLAATRWAVDELADTLPAVVVERWADAAQAVVDACRDADPSRPVLAHDLPTDIDGLLVLRAFELWAHLEDVCAATGRLLPPVDAPRLTLMSQRLMGALPLAVAWRQTTVPMRSVRFVLTGPGGGCYDVDLAAAGVGGAGDEVTIVADTTDVCRVAARRLDATDLDAVVEGDGDAALALLATVDAFARD
jgi:uncharacterized protein (TIGR03083 family)